MIQMRKIMLVIACILPCVSFIQGATDKPTVIIVPQENRYKLAVKATGAGLITLICGLAGIKYGAQGLSLIPENARKYEGTERMKMLILAPSTLLCSSASLFYVASKTGRYCYKLIETLRRNS